jgi:uncharacterized protein YdcH (DUF465 family)
VHDPFDNPEIAAASHQRGGGGWVVNARPVPAAPVIPQRPVPAGRGVSVCGPAICTGIAQRMPASSAARPAAGCVSPGGASRRSPRATGLPAGWRIADQEAFMFEAQPQAEIEAMMKANSEFRQLYFRHRELDKQVLDAELGVLPIDDATLGQMKREKLAAKQRLLQMYERAN